MNTFVIVDSSQVPKASKLVLRDGAILSLEGALDLKCLVGFIVVTDTDGHVVSSCRICSVVYIESTYEFAEAKVVRHLRQKHDIYARLWQYAEDLVVHPIP